MEALYNYFHDWVQILYPQLVLISSYPLIQINDYNTFIQVPKYPDPPTA